MFTTEIDVWTDTNQTPLDQRGLLGVVFSQIGVSGLIGTRNPNIDNVTREQFNRSGIRQIHDAFPTPIGPDGRPLLEGLIASRYLARSCSNAPMNFGRTTGVKAMFIRYMKADGELIGITQSNVTIGSDGTNLWRSAINHQLNSRLLFGRVVGQSREILKPSIHIQATASHVRNEDVKREITAFTRHCGPGPL